MSLSAKIIMVFLTGLAFKVQAQCLGEAQIIAPIVSIESDNLRYCKVYIDQSKTRVYNQSMVCPLDISEVVAQGVEVGLQNGHECRMQPGEELNGVIVKTKTGSIIWEDGFPGYNQ